MSAKTWLVLYDRHYRILWISDGFGPYSASSVVGHFPWEFLAPHHVEKTIAALARCVALERPEQVDALGLHGEWWRARLWPVSFPRVRIVGLCRQFPPGFETLTDREKELCGMVAAGLSAKQLASRLGIARSTVDNHKAHIARKVGIPTSALAAWCGVHSEWFSEFPLRGD